LQLRVAAFRLPGRRCGREFHSVPNLEGRSMSQSTPPLPHLRPLDQRDPTSASAGTSASERDVSAKPAAGRISSAGVSMAQETRAGETPAGETPGRERTLEQVRELLFGEEVSRQTEAYRSLDARLAAVEADFSQQLQALSDRMTARDQDLRRQRDDDLRCLRDGLRALADQIERAMGGEGACDGEPVQPAARGRDEPATSSCEQN